MLGKTSLRKNLLKNALCFFRIFFCFRRTKKNAGIGWTKQNLTVSVGFQLEGATSVPSPAWGTGWLVEKGPPRGPPTPCPGSERRHGRGPWVDGLTALHASYRNPVRCTKARLPTQRADIRTWCLAILTVTLNWNIGGWEGTWYNPNWPSWGEIFPC